MSSRGCGLFMSDIHPLIIICGPTGVGKSTAALALAHQLEGEIVSADAGQVYRGFDIGTAKPSQEEQAEIRHHGIDLWEADVQSDAVLWQRAADEAIADIRERGKTPIVVGGTGFYLRTLIHGVFPGPDPDPKLRRALQEAFQSEGGEALHRRLSEVDPAAARSIHPNDPVRLTRAIEYYEQTGERISEARAKHRFQEERYQAMWVGLNCAREQLYERIDSRVVTMMKRGWRDEAEALYKKWGGDVPAFQIIGYRQWREHFEGRLPEPELIPTIQQASRQYAKRQLTWFRGDANVHWLDAKDTEGILNTYSSFLDK